MYTIKKIFNNNVLQAEDDNQKEYVLMGKGIGFSTSAGDRVDLKKVEKIFKLDGSEHGYQFGSFLSNLNDSNLETIREIVEYANEKMNVPLSNSIYFGLSDHISFAIERLESGISFRNPLQWEIKKAYPKAYAVGEAALRIVNENLKVQLPQEEVASLAMHVINASDQNSSFEMLYEEMELMQDILRIVKLHFMVDFDEESANYERFIVHLKFFIHRLRKNEQLLGSNETFYKMAVKNWPNTYECVVKITKRVKQSKDRIINDEELFYLMVHINRLIDIAHHEERDHYGKTSERDTR